MPAGVDDAVARVGDAHAVGQVARDEDAVRAPVVLERRAVEGDPRHVVGVLVVRGAIYNSCFAIGASCNSLFVRRCSMDKNGGIRPHALESIIPNRLDA